MRRPKRALAVVLAASVAAGVVTYLASGRPHAPRHHGVLVFGPEAAVRVRVAVDGDGVQLDLDGDGRFAGAAERFASADAVKDVSIADPDGVTTYLLSRLSVQDEALPDGRRVRVLTPWVEVRGPVSYQQYGCLFLTPPPAEAPVAHFHGPLEARPEEVLWELPPGLKLKAGGKPTDLRMLVGTMDAARGCWVVVATHERDRCAFPAGVRPTVAVEFPPKAPGGPPVRRTYPLDGFC